MIEVELKAALDARQPVDLVSALSALGFFEQAAVQESDVYYNGCGRDFRRTDEALRLRKSEAVLEQYRALLREDVELFIYIQFLFFKQWTTLRSYLHQLDIQVIGDLPIYVPMDSADVWAEPQFFQLDDQCVPTAVSGVPPDYFSADGQLWGTPLYRWDVMEADGYGWWIRRIDGAGKLYDVIRIDHFRGLDTYWAVPYGEPTARNGQWQQGPGMSLIRALTGWFPRLSFIAEDLGYPTPSVQQLLHDSGWPGMKVLEFAFDSRDTSNYLPHTYPRHCVCYTGTHDNSPVELWRQEAAPEDIAYAAAYLGLNPEEGFHWGVLRGGLSSVADLFVAQMQDYLGLGEYHRMNVPGKLGGNWQWRLLPGEASGQLAEKIRRMAVMYGRAERPAPAPDAAPKTEKPQETAAVKA